MTIALLCPTRGRPAQFQRMCNSVKETTSTQVEIFSATNADDSYAKTKFPHDCPTAFMWNKLAEFVINSRPEITHFMLASDDMIFANANWDIALRDKYDETPHVYHLQDSRDENGTPHPIVTREWIKLFGWFLPPMFMHWMVDSWTVDVAKSNNCFTHMKEYLLIHDKPSDVGKPDETYTRIRSMGWHQRDMWVHEKSKDILEMYKKKLKDNLMEIERARLG